VVEGVAAAPAGQVLPVEQRRVTGGGSFRPAAMAAGTGARQASETMDTAGVDGPGERSSDFMAAYIPARGVWSCVNAGTDGHGRIPLSCRQRRGAPSEPAGTCAGQANDWQANVGWLIIRLARHSPANPLACALPWPCWG